MKKDFFKIRLRYRYIFNIILRKNFHQKVEISAVKKAHGIFILLNAADTGQ